jgi:hypothetical protein
MLPASGSIATDAAMRVTRITLMISMAAIDYPLEPIVVKSRSGDAGA